MIPKMKAAQIGHPAGILNWWHPMVEKYPLSEVGAAYEQMHSGRARFRVVLMMGN